MEIGDIRDFLVVITTIITILGVFFKAVNSFFLDIIKNSFEVIPGKNSLYNTVIKTITQIVIFIEIIIAIGIFILMLFKIGNFVVIILKSNYGELGNKISRIDIIYVSIKIFINILDFALMYLIVFSGRIIIYLLREVFKVLGIKEESDNNKFNKFFEKHLKVSTKSVSKINAFKTVANILVAICIIAIIVLNSRDLLGERIILGIIAVFGTSVSIILNSLNSIIKMLSKKYKYHIILKNNNIYIVNFFLELDNNYLIVEQGIQRYISKQEVGEIKKVLIE